MLNYQNIIKELLTIHSILDTTEDLSSFLAEKLLEIHNINESYYEIRQERQKEDIDYKNKMININNKFKELQKKCNHYDATCYHGSNSDSYNECNICHKTW